MLHIKDMVEIDRLFNFLSGFQPWTQLELRQQGVKDLPAALVATDGLDLRVSKPNNSFSMSMSGFVEKSHKKKAKFKDAREKKTKEADKGKAKVEGSHQRRDQANLHPSCFIYNSSHLACNCPRQD